MTETHWVRASSKHLSLLFGGRPWFQLLLSAWLNIPGTEFQTAPSRRSGAVRGKSATVCEGGCAAKPCYSRNNTRPLQKPPGQIEPTCHDRKAASVNFHPQVMYSSKTVSSAHEHNQPTGSFVFIDLLLHYMSKSSLFIILDQLHLQ